jgi:hypothetical protein
LLVASCGASPKPVVSAKPPEIADAGAESGATGAMVKLVAPGAEPRAPLVYTFSNKTRTVNATITVGATGAGAPAMDQPPIHVVFTATPRPNGTSGSTIDIKVTKFDVALPNPSTKEIEQKKALLERAIVGMSGHFDATTHGDIENIELDRDTSAEGISDVWGLIQQALEFLVIPLPNEPVGIGAKWTKSESKNVTESHATISTTVTLALQSRDEETATIRVDATTGGTMQISDPRAPAGSSMDRKTTAAFTVVIRHDGISKKVDGDSKNAITQKVPGQNDQTMMVTIGQHIESE